MRVALVSREVYPYAGGGIAPIVTAAARLLSTVAEVTLVTGATYRADHERLRAAGDPRVLPEAVRLAWVDEPEPDEAAAHMSYMHAYSARVYSALRAAYPEQGPDLIEFPDYLGEGFVTVQARHTHDPWLERTLVCVRIHTTGEVCAVLDGHMPDDFQTIAVHDAERYALRHADRLLWSGGDVLDSYRRFYGASSLAPAERIRDAFLVEAGAAADPPGRRPAPDGERLKLLYVGRAERRKGVQNLVRAMTSIGRSDVRLTLLGGDTSSAPLQTSLLAQLKSMAAEDDRIRFLDPVPRSRIPEHIAAADVVVVPSLWECWPNVAREALMNNRPVLATPVGGLTEIVTAGRTGWFSRDTSPGAIADAIEALAQHRGEVTRVIESGGPRDAFLELTDSETFVGGYRRLLAGGRHAPAPRARRDPLVSVVIPYFCLERHVDETVHSALAQTHQPVEVVVVNDGSLRAADAILYDGMPAGVRVLTQPNAGLSSARNLGISQARGTYVLPLDADDVLDPTFVERCLAALERDAELAYVTTWAQYLAPDGTPLEKDPCAYMPFGNWSRLMERNNVGGTCASLFRRRVFELGFAYSPDLTSYEDWLLYYQLRRAGYHGAVVPERLLRYRVRPESMMRIHGAPRMDRILDEIRAHLREGEMRWVTSAG